MVRLARHSIVLRFITGVSICGRAQAVDATIEPTFAGIKAAIAAYEEQNPGETLTIAAILERLPERFRSGYTLMYNSQSIQSSEFANPRVIMYGDDARTVMTFNGHAGQLGYERLEFATLNPKTEQIELAMIEFPMADTGFGKAVASGPNPTLCTTCHGNDKPHYIWGQYARWPGAYGSMDDVLELVPGEKDNYLAFLTTAPQHPRYRNLVREFDSFTAVAPYRAAQPEMQNPLERSQYEFGIEQRTNFRFGALAMRNQARARAAQIAASPLFEKYKHGFAFALAGCDRFASDEAVSLYRHDGLKGYEEYARKLGSDPKVDWHLEKGLGRTTDYSYYAGLNTFPSAFQAILWPLAFKDEPDVLRYFKPSNFGDFVRLDKTYRFKVSERGQELWDVLDHLAPIVTTFSGAGEADTFIREANLPYTSDSDARAVCKVLAKKQLAKP